MSYRFLLLGPFKRTHWHAHKLTFTAIFIENEYYLRESIQNKTFHSHQQTYLQ